MTARPVATKISIQGGSCQGVILHERWVTRTICGDHVVDIMDVEPRATKPYPPLSEQLPRITAY